MSSLLPPTRSSSPKDLTRSYTPALHSDRDACDLSWPVLSSRTATAKPQTSQPPFSSAQVRRSSHSHPNPANSTLVADYGSSHGFISRPVTTSSTSDSTSLAQRFASPRSDSQKGSGPVQWPSSAAASVSSASKLTAAALLSSSNVSPREQVSHSDIALYSRLVPTTSTVPRRPNQPLRGSSAPATQSSMRPAASNLLQPTLPSASNGATSHSHAMTFSSAREPSSSLPNTDRQLLPRKVLQGVTSTRQSTQSRLQSLSSHSTADQLSRRIAPRAIKPESSSVSVSAYPDTCTVSVGSSRLSADSRLDANSLKTRSDVSSSTDADQRTLGGSERTHSPTPSDIHGSPNRMASSSEAGRSEIEHYLKIRMQPVGVSGDNSSRFMNSEECVNVFHDSDAGHPEPELRKETFAGTSRSVSELWPSDGALASQASCEGSRVGREGSLQPVPFRRDQIQVLRGQNATSARTGALHSHSINAKSSKQSFAVATQNGRNGRSGLSSNRKGGAPTILPPQPLSPPRPVNPRADVLRHEGLGDKASANKRADILSNTLRRQSESTTMESRDKPVRLLPQASQALGSELISYSESNCSDANEASTTLSTASLSDASIASLSSSHSPNVAPMSTPSIACQYSVPDSRSVSLEDTIHKQSNLHSSTSADGYSVLDHVLDSPDPTRISNYQGTGKGRKTDWGRLEPSPSPIFDSSSFAAQQSTLSIISTATSAPDSPQSASQQSFVSLSSAPEVYCKSLSGGATASSFSVSMSASGCMNLSTYPSSSRLSAVSVSENGFASDLSTDNVSKGCASGALPNSNALVEELVSNILADDDFMKGSADAVAAVAESCGSKANWCSQSACDSFIQGPCIARDVADDDLLPPLPDSHQEEFESLLRAMGWQPLDDDDDIFG